MHYRALPIARKVVEGLPEIQAKHDGYAKDVRREIKQRRNFQVVKVKQKEFWKSSTPMYAVLCHQAH